MPWLERNERSASRCDSKRRRPFLTKSCRFLHLESLEDRRLLALTGDAPAPYPAASVSAQTGPILGATRTIDDGVLFGDLRVGQLGVAVSIEVTSASAGTVIDGWIDFNRDGSFGGAWEQVFDSKALTNGITDLKFDVPSWADDGQTYARFRISQGIPAGVSQGGSVANGEVEDYPISIHRPFIGSGDFGTERTITNNGASNGVVDVLPVDIDKDGKMDVVASSHIDGRIIIYRSNASLSSWTGSVIGLVDPTGDPNEVNAVRLAAGDLDGDDDIDLVSASNKDDTIAWYRNNGDASFTKFTVTSTANGARAVVVADFDRDGRLDLASLSLFDDTMRIHQNTGSATSALLFNTAVAVTFPSDSSPADMHACDIDRDGWEDIVSITAVTNRVAWHRNDGTPFSGSWGLGTTIFDAVDSDTPGGSGVFAGDIDGELDLDVVAASFNEDRVDWFRNSSGGTSWSPRLAVGGSIDGANPPFVADIDGDGDMDVVTPAFLGGAVLFHRNNGTGTFSLGDTVPFSTGTRLAVADINGDGALDLVAGGHDKDRVSWWENPRLLPEIAVTGESLVINDGDSSPRAADGTDFGDVIQGGATVSKLFVIENTGVGTLAIGTPTVPNGFTLLAEPAPYLPPGESTEFTVRLNTTTTGTKSGQITFDTNDANEDPFNFSITGKVTAPEIAVTGNGINIVDGDSTPAPNDGTDFGSVEQGGSTVSKMFTVRNDGDAKLTLSSLTVPDGYTITENLSSSLDPGTSDSFTVRLNTTTTGTKSGQITFDTNDANEDPFNFSITGKVTSLNVPPGDYNKDHVVDSLDYQVWRKSFGATGSNLEADGNGNNIVDAADYVFWRNNLGAMSTSQSTASGSAEFANVLLKPAGGEPTVADATVDAIDAGFGQFGGQPVASHQPTNAPAGVARLSASLTNPIENSRVLLWSRSNKPTTAKWMRPTSALVDDGLDNLFLLVGCVRSESKLINDVKPDDAQRARASGEAVETVDVAIAAFGEDAGAAWHIR
jgi:hypothetical protein